MSDQFVIALSIGAIALAIGSMAVVRHHRTLIGVGWTVVGIGLLIVAVVEPRWMLIPLCVGVLLGVLTGVIRSREPSPSRRRARAIAFGAGTATISAIAAAAVAATAAWALPTVNLPRPGGEFSVGTRLMQWDTGVPEPGSPDPTDTRILVAQSWYPTTETGVAQSYLPDSTVTSALAEQAGLPGFLLDGVAIGRTNSVADATVAEGTFPLVIFSPGLGGVRTQNTVWAEALASNGYVVVAIDHPYDSAAVVFSDGTVIRSTLRSTGNDDADQRIADDLAMSRASDLLATLDHLEQFFDTDQVVAAGHSIGGAAAILAAARDDRVDAVINLDGLPRGGRPTVPILAVVAGGGTGSIESDRRYEAALDDVLMSCGTRRVAPGARHLSFTDAALFLPPLPSLIGDRGRTEGLDFAISASLEFLAGIVESRQPPCAP